MEESWIPDVLSSLQLQIQDSEKVLRKREVLLDGRMKKLRFENKMTIHVD